MTQAYVTPQVIGAPAYYDIINWAWLQNSRDTPLCKILDPPLVVATYSPRTARSRCSYRQARCVVKANRPRAPIELDSYARHGGSVGLLSSYTTNLKATHTMRSIVGWQIFYVKFYSLHKNTEVYSCGWLMLQYTRRKSVLTEHNTR